MIKWSKTFICTTTLFLGLSLVSAFTGPATSYAAVANATVTLDGNKLDIAPQLKNGTTYLALRDLAAGLGMSLYWEAADKKVVAISPQGKAVLQVGNKSLSVNGAARTANAAPYVSDGRVYVPLRELATLTGYKVDWDAIHKNIILQTTDPFIQAHAGDLTVWISYNSRAIYYAKNKDAPQKVVTSLPDLKGKPQLLQADVQVLSDDSFLVSMTDSYGDPLTNQDRYQVLIERGQAVRTAKVHYEGARTVDGLAAVEGRAVMLDGDDLRVVLPSGAIDREYDLATLLGQTGPYIIEGVYDDFLLVRDQPRSLLIGYDLKRQIPIFFYKQLLPSTDQTMIEEWDPMDINYPGDQIKFVKKEGSTLFFERKGTAYKYEISAQ